MLPLAMAAWSACAQQAGQTTGSGRSYAIVPTASLDLTATDNADLSQRKEADLLTRASVGFGAYSRSGRIRGSVDYTLSGIAHSSSSNRNEVQQSLNGLGSAELVQNRLFVDLTGNISQQAISAFGQQTADRSLGDNNRTQVSTFGVAPYLRGTLAGLFAYEARFSGTHTHSGSGSASDNTITSARGHLDSGRSGTAVSWSADLTRQNTDYSLGRRTEEDRLALTLGYMLNLDTRVSLIGGRESNNYVSDNKTSHTNIGAQLAWKPSNRTSVNALYERRFFGTAHSVEMSYRTARTAWSYIDTRDVSSSPAQAGLTIGSQYQLYDALFTATEPDPAKRDVLVRQFLAANNIDVNAPVVTGFVPAAVSLQRTRALSFVLSGIRDTLTLRANRSESSQLDRATPGVDDLSTAGRVRQTGLLVDLSHRLTPVSSIGVTGAWQRTTGVVSTQKSTLSSATMNYTTRIGLRADASVGARHTRFIGNASYGESAVFANVRVRF